MDPTLLGLFFFLVFRFFFFFSFCCFCFSSTVLPVCVFPVWFLMFYCVLLVFSCVDPLIFLFVFPVCVCVSRVGFPWLCGARKCSMVSTILEPQSAQMVSLHTSARMRVALSAKNNFWFGFSSDQGGGSTGIERRELAHSRSGNVVLVALALASCVLGVDGLAMRSSFKPRALIHELARLSRPVMGCYIINSHLKKEARSVLRTVMSVHLRRFLLSLGSCSENSSFRAQKTERFAYDGSL